jgi:predicted nucleic acid-binding protein
VPVFVDTSDLYALLNAGDAQHAPAAGIWSRLFDRREELITSNYVLVESMALIARRLGLAALRDFQGDFVPVLQPVWVDEALHNRAVAALLTVGIRDLSLVACVSFEIMRSLGLDTAFAIDDHFNRQGFTCLP